METAQRVPILVYHRVGEVHNMWERKYCISPQRFSEHMCMRATQGVRACDIDDFIAWLNGDLSESALGNE